MRKLGVTPEATSTPPLPQYHYVLPVIAQVQLTLLFQETLILQRGGVRRLGAGGKQVSEYVLPLSGHLLPTTAFA